MYVVRERKTKRIVHLDPSPLSKRLKATDVYAAFDADKMELLKTDLEKLPPHYTVDRNGRIKPLSLEEQVKQGLKVLAPHQKAVGDKIVEKSSAEMLSDGLIQLSEPFEYLDSAGKVTKRSARELIEQRLLSTQEQVEKVCKMIDAQTATAIESSYPPKLEIRLTKNFMLWMYEGQKKEDAREQAFIEMESFIESVRSSGAALKSAARSLIQSESASNAENEPLEEPNAEHLTEATDSSADALPEGNPDEFWTVQNIRSWMDAHNISYVNRDSKSELLEKIKEAQS